MSESFKGEWSYSAVLLDIFIPEILIGGYLGPDIRAFGDNPVVI